MIPGKLQHDITQQDISECIVKSPTYYNMANRTLIHQSLVNDTTLAYANKNRQYNTL